jgi:YihY family inner membrane protein
MKKRGMARIVYCQAGGGDAILGCFMWKWLYGSVLLAKIDRLGTYAAALAYCFVLSLVPFLIVSFALSTRLMAPFHVDLANAYIDVLDSVLPIESQGDPGRLPTIKPANTRMDVETDAESIQNKKFKKADLNAKESANTTADLIIKSVQSMSKGGLLTIGFVLAVYTSFNLMMQIVRSLLFIFDDPRRPQEWGWIHGFKSVALLFIWMGLMLVISITSVLTFVVQQLLDQFHFISAAGQTPFLLMRDLVVLAALFGAFFLTYALVSTKKYETRLVVEGSLLATGGWVLCSLIFAYLLPNHLWNKSAVYGVLGSVIGVLIWAQACAWSVIVGACWIVRFSPRR